MAEKTAVPSASVREGRLLRLAALALGAVVLLDTAWLHEDAYITLRSVDNWVNGFGLRWNIAERVQSYTHPLWALLLAAAYAVRQEAYFTTLALCLVCSLAALALLAFRIARTPPLALVLVVSALFSRSFVEYSTSGLENPLSHLLLAGFVLAFLEGSFTREGAAAEGERMAPALVLMGALAGLVYLTRQDLALLVFPALALAFARSRRLRLRALLALVLLPLLWTAFSLFYYGFAFPNTAYAKLSTGLDRVPLVVQGLHYLANSWRNDPVTLLLLAFAVVAALVSRSSRNVALVAGSVLYLAYVVVIGGDCMSGRFLAAPFFVSLAVLARSGLDERRCLLPALAVAVLVGALSPYPPPFSGPDFGGPGHGPKQDAHRIDDVRAIFFPTAGLLPVWKNGGEPFHEWAEDGRRARVGGPRIVVRRPIGFFGYYAGPDVHVIDALALTEPLLARLPTNETETLYPGHYPRYLPAGYWETVSSGENRIVDRDLAAYYDRLRLVIRGPLLDRARLVEVWRLNTGRYDDLLAAPYQRLFNRALERVRRGDHAGALRLMDAAVKLAPQRAEAWYALARVRHGAGDQRGAEQASRRAVELDPAQPVYRALAARLAGDGTETARSPSGPDAR